MTLGRIPRGRKYRTMTNRKRVTSLTFTAAELQDLAKLAQAGVLALQYKSPVIARIKNAMTRLGLSAPSGI